MEVDIGCDKGKLAAYAAQLDLFSTFFHEKSDDPLSPEYMCSV